jgi:outer membrane lipoprotein-sorting protein
MRLLGLTCLLSILAVAGCRTIPPPAPVPRFASSEELLSILKARQTGLESFQANGRLTLIAPGRSYSGTARLKGSLPSTLRVDVLDFFNRSLLNFASDGQQVEVLFPREGKLFYGPATPANLAAFVPPGVTLEQALKVLAGDLPLSAGEPAEYRYDAAAEAYLMTWRNSGGSFQEKLWVDSQSLYPVKDEWYGSDGRLTFTAELSEFVGNRPQQITFKTTEPVTELRLALQNMQLNPSFTQADLRVPHVPGVERVPFRP